MSKDETGLLLKDQFPDYSLGRNSEVTMFNGAGLVSRLVQGYDIIYTRMFQHLLTSLLKETQFFQI